MKIAYCLWLQQHVNVVANSGRFYPDSKAFQVVCTAGATDVVRIFSLSAGRM